jgi:hypothetical protein
VTTFQPPTQPIGEFATAIQAYVDGVGKFTMTKQ